MGAFLNDIDTVSFDREISYLLRELYFVSVPVMMQLDARAVPCASNLTNVQRSTECLAINLASRSFLGDDLANYVPRGHRFVVNMRMVLC